MCETLFVCLPTPMKSSGKCDFCIIENVLNDIDLLVDNLETKRTIIIKSTIPPVQLKDGINTLIV